MKKLVALLLAGVMTFSLAACGNSSQPAAEPAPAEEAAPAEEQLRQRKQLLRKRQLRQKAQQ